MVRRKDLKKALYLLKKYNQTPIEVIEYIENKLFANESVNINENDVQPLNKTINIGECEYMKLIDGIATRNNGKTLSKGEFNKFKYNFWSITGEPINLKYEDFVRAEKYTIDGMYLNAVKHVKDATSYNLVTSKRITDALRVLHKKNI